MKAIITFAVFFISNTHLFAQWDTIKVSKISRTVINYNSYTIVNNNLFAVNDSGKVIIWDLQKLDTIHFAYNNGTIKYTAITKDKEDNVFLGTAKGEVFKINTSNFIYSFVLKAKYSIKYMCFNSFNKLFLIVPSAVYDPTSLQRWDQFENHANGMITFRRKRIFIFFHKNIKITKHFAMPQYTFIDSDDNWWMTAVYGEFGGELEIFNTQNKVIANNKFAGIIPGDLAPRSVFEDEQKNIYITCGLQHFINFGEIFKIDKNRKVIKIFDGITNSDTVKKRNAFDSSRDFVGPGAYNKFDKNIYFATSNGFYYADPNKDKIYPKFLFDPILNWSREPQAIGVAMSILKLDFTIDNKLLFLTQNDGFGIYHGKELKMFK